MAAGFQELGPLKPVGYIGVMEQNADQSPPPQRPWYSVRWSLLFWIAAFFALQLAFDYFIVHQFR